MAAYDALPRRVQRLIDDGPGEVSTIAILAHYRQAGEAEVVRTLINSFNVYLAACAKRNRSAAMPMDADAQFFADHPDRKTHIRPAHPGEAHAEFAALGPHDAKRRRILIWKAPDDAPIGAGQLMPVPMLAFSDETIADDDKVLLPILAKIMADAQETDQRQHPELYRRQ